MLMDNNNLIEKEYLYKNLLPLFEKLVNFIDMYSFIFKKNFCDGWDNLLSLVVFNALFVFTLFGGVSLIFAIVKAFAYMETINGAELTSITSTGKILFFLALALIIFVIAIIHLAFGELANSIADFGGSKIVDFFKHVPGVLKDSFFLTIFIIVVGGVSIFSIQFYLQQNSLLYFAMAALIFWIDLFIILAFQWFVPIRSEFHNNFKKIIKKCFIMLFDNTACTLIMAIYNLFLTVISIFFVGFVPSLTGILISNANFFRIRLYKYDYLEEHPELQTKQEKKQIPWEELIYEDRETLGPRKLKSFLFPWKE